jgi:hypothetical protein
LSKNAVEDALNVGNLIETLADLWGEDVRVTKETFAARVFNEGGNLTGDWIYNGTHTGNAAPYGDMLYDNKPLFTLTGNKRTSKGGGTYYNSVASLTICPGDFETLYNLHTVTNAVNERDKIVRNPADTLLCRPGANLFLAKRLLHTEKGLPGGQMNDINPYMKLVEPMDWDYLEAAEGSMYIGKKQSDTFQFRERQQPEIRFTRNEKNLCYEVSINIRIGVMITDYKTWSRGAGTSA